MFHFNHLKDLKENKRGDIESLIFIVAILLVVGFSLITINNMNDKLFTALDENFAGNTDINGTTAHTTVQAIHSKDNAVWDYAFLGIFLGSVFALGMSAYSVRISPIFYWVYGLLTFIILLLGVAASNMWQSAVASDVYADALTRFPITNFVLGDNFPFIITGVIVLTMILLFAKTPEP